MHGKQLQLPARHALHELSQEWHLPWWCKRRAGGGLLAFGAKLNPGDPRSSGQRRRRRLFRHWEA